MLDILPVFLFLFKSKYRRKSCAWWPSKCDFVIFAALVFGSTASAQCIDSCSGNGVCRNDTCICYDGWQGPQCEFCGGKVRLGSSTGSIFDGPGNYSLTNKCSWLIDAPNSTITLHIEEFGTECGWDYLYVFDGDSADSPLLAAFSGLMYKDSYSIKRIPEVTATSGSALIHFFSDDAYNMTGFNITYSLNSCPTTKSVTNCSDNGVCIDGVCTCNGGWGGLACHLENCPNECGAPEHRGHCVPDRGCYCIGNYTGEDCSQIRSEGYWETVNVHGFVPPGSASHGAVVWKDSMYITGGESYRRGFFLYVYDFNGRVWETPHFQNPDSRYGHSTVFYGDKIFIYGGVLGNRGPTSELWAFDISAKTWENITVKTDSCNNSFLECGPLQSTGHSATVVDNLLNGSVDRMIIIFGHSPYLGYLNTVQEYYFGTREWHIVPTKGYPVKGGYGHSASWDPLTSKIYVYGGVISESESSQFLSRHLYLYDPNTHIWRLLADAPSARFLHTAIFVTNGLMLVFGGNTHNDTSHSFGAKCYSSDLLAYDVLCDTWSVLSVPKDLRADMARFGHSAVVFESSLYIYGGFDGQMLSDMLRYNPGNCSYTNETACLNTQPGVKCVWNTKTNTCAQVMNVSRDLLLQNEESYIIRCPSLSRFDKTIKLIQNKQKCEEMKDCLSCTHTTSGCLWFGNVCSLTKPFSEPRDNGTALVSKLTQCPIGATSICNQLHACKACTSQPTCRWRIANAKCVPRSPENDITTEADSVQCQSVCSEYNSCLTCTQEECIWCQNEGRCVDKNAYTSSFPYGQCREWTTNQMKCRTRGSNENSQCRFYKTCTKCRDDPACGWCDDGSKTGLGRCMLGGYAGPNLYMESLPSTTCPAERWHFTTCPLCQCNGHSSCKGDTSTCISCGNLTIGNHCEFCQKGYWGNALNGGKCAPCNCNEQADDCHPETGQCYCKTKGFIGDQCEKCDTNNHYDRDPINKLCSYDLTLNYQFTFNLSKKGDLQYTKINYKNSPIQADIDTDFSIICSVPAKMNITVREGNSPERDLYSNHICNTFSAKFSKSEYHFGVEDNVALTTFYVYVYDFKPPLWIQISFSQYPKLH